MYALKIIALLIIIYILVSLLLSLLIEILDCKWDLDDGYVNRVYCRTKRIIILPIILIFKRRY